MFSKFRKIIITVQSERCSSPGNQLVCQTQKYYFSLQRTRLLYSRVHCVELFVKSMNKKSTKTECVCFLISRLLYLLHLLYLCVCIRVCFFSLGAVSVNGSHLFLSLSVSVTKLQSLLSLRNVTFFFLSDSLSQLSHYSSVPCCRYVLEDKVNTLSEFALPL